MDWRVVVMHTGCSACTECEEAAKAHAVATDAATASSSYMLTYEDQPRRQIHSAEVWRDL